MSVRTWLFAVTVMDLLLVFDPRYRDFPSLLFAAPGGALVLLSIITSATEVGSEVTLEERLCALWLLVASVLIVVIERPSNLSADFWALLAGVCALVALRQTRSSHEDLVLPAGQHERAHGEPDGTGLVAVQDEPRPTDG